MAKKTYQQKKDTVLPMGKAATADYVSMHARKIDNGHIVTHTHGDGKGYHTTETYHKELPLEINAVKPHASTVSGDGENNLKKAIDRLNRC